MVIKRWWVMLVFVRCVQAGTSVNLWSGPMPCATDAEPESVLPDRGDSVIRITHVSVPTLELFLLKNHKEPTPFVIICPGGGYSILCMNKEGTEVAEWLNTIGISAGVLKYRCPKNRKGALADANQSIRLARKQANAWGIDPQRIGMLGFSAGGHLTAACCNCAERPDFSILIYPAYLYQKETLKLIDDMEVSAATPPAFLVQALDDKKYYHSTLAYTEALDAAGIPVESHLFAKGGHGFGLRPSEHPVSMWPQLCEAWMREMQFLK